MRAQFGLAAKNAIHAHSLIAGGLHPQQAFNHYALRHEPSLPAMQLRGVKTFQALHPELLQALTPAQRYALNGLEIRIFPSNGSDEIRRAIQLVNKKFFEDPMQVNPDKTSVLGGEVVQLQVASGGRGREGSLYDLKFEGDQRLHAHLKGWRLVDMLAQEPWIFKAGGCYKNSQSNVPVINIQMPAGRAVVSMKKGFIHAFNALGAATSVHANDPKEIAQVKKDLHRQQGDHLQPNMNAAHKDLMQYLTKEIDPTKIINAGTFTAEDIQSILPLINKSQPHIPEQEWSR